MLISLAERVITPQYTLIKLTDLFFRSTDDCDNFIRILCVDFAKAFDLVDHNVLSLEFLQ
jgi:hypothetical protein